MEILMTRMMPKGTENTKLDMYFIYLAHKTHVWVDDKEIANELGIPLLRYVRLLKSIDGYVKVGKDSVFNSISAAEQAKEMLEHFLLLNELSGKCYDEYKFTT